MSLIVLQSPLFSKQKKKLHSNQIEILDQEIQKIIENPRIGEQKRGDLKAIWVHKFNASSQLFLLAYKWDSQTRHLIAIHAHENFYRDLKRYLK